MTRSPTPWRLAAGACSAALLAGLPLSAPQAATTTATFTVTADVQTTCNVTAQNLNFGAYAGVELDISTTLTATCSSGTPYSVGLSAGTSTGATVTARKMTGPGADPLAYSLSQDAAHSINWGDTIGTDTVPGTGNGLGQTLTVFGRVPAGQFVGPGAYTDTITVTLTF
jgi:spore coat protein U-like protein